MSTLSRVRPAIPLIVLLAVGLLPGLRMLAAIWSSVGPDGLSGVTRKLPVVDFANLWSGGRLARLHDLPTLFDPDAYRAWLRARFAPGYESSEWSYPPPMLLLGIPLSLLGVLPAYALWQAATAAALALVLRRQGCSAVVVILALASPAMLQSVIFGQNGALTATLLAGALLSARPMPAGLCAGLFLLKPQLGVLLPAVFLAAGRLRAIVAALATAALLAIVTTAVLGPGVWMLFWTRTRPLMVAVMQAPWPSGHLANGVTVFFSARSLGLPLDAAYAVQGAVSLAALAATVIIWRRFPAERAMLFAATVALGLLATPYAYSYDLVALAAAAGLMLLRPGARPIAVLAWLWPGLTGLLGYQGWLLSPLVFAAFAAQAVWIMAHAEAGLPAQPLPSAHNQPA